MRSYKNHFSMIIASVIAIVLSLIMSASAIFIDNLTFSIPLAVKNWGTCFLVITLTGLIFPLSDWSFALCRVMKLKPMTFLHILVENFVMTFFFNTFATLVLAAVNIFGSSQLAEAAAAGQIPSVSFVYWNTVLHDWWIMFIISFIIAFFVTKLAIKIAIASTGIDPMATHRDAS